MALTQVQGGMLAGSTNTTTTIQSNGTTAITIDSSQNVGIGTTPVNSRKLTAATASQTDLSLVAGSSNYAQLLFGYTGADNKGIVAYNNADNSMQFYTNSSERMRITSAGVAQINTTAAVPAAGVDTKLMVAGTDGILDLYSNSNGASYYGVTLRNNNANNGGLQGVIFINATSVSYNSPSDYRLKDDVQPMVGALDKVKALKPCTFTWKSTGEVGQGFIAHELQEIVPDCVVGEKDAVHEDGSIDGQQVDTGFLIATLTAAIQELNAKVEAQAAEIAALKVAK